MPYGGKLGMKICMTLKFSVRHQALMFAKETQELVFDLNHALTGLK